MSARAYRLGLVAVFMASCVALVALGHAADAGLLLLIAIIVMVLG